MRLEVVCCFFFQAEDGIRDGHVTGVQTCALPILPSPTTRRQCPSVPPPRSRRRRRRRAGAQRRQWRARLQRSQARVGFLRTDSNARSRSRAARPRERIPPCAAPKWRAARSARKGCSGAPSVCLTKPSRQCSLAPCTRSHRKWSCAGFLEDTATMETQPYCIGLGECEGLVIDDATSTERSLHCAATAVGSTKSLNRSRSTVFWILPVAVCGISSTKTTSSGIHQLATFPRMNVKISSLVAD